MNIDMRKIIFIGMIIGIFISACEKDDSYLELSETEIQLDAAGAEQYIQVNTNAITWQISSSSDWVIAERDSCFLVIKAGSNQVRSERNAKVVIVADNKYVRINISQAASTRCGRRTLSMKQTPLVLSTRSLMEESTGKSFLWMNLTGSGDSIQTQE
ncbi:MAG: BACON domain-containing protein [Butyricimonas faecalis]